MVLSILAIFVCTSVKGRVFKLSEVACRNQGLLCSRKGYHSFFEKLISGMNYIIIF